MSVCLRNILLLMEMDRCVFSETCSAVWFLVTGTLINTHLGYDRNRIFRPDTGMEAKSGSGIAGKGMLFQNSGSGKAGKGMLF